MAPIEYPVLKIGDKEYTLRLRASDVMALKKDKIDILSKESFTQAIQDRGILDFYLRMLQSLIAHQEELSADQIASGVEFARMGEIAMAVNESLKKAWGQIAADGPKVETPPTPPAIQ